MELGNTTFYLGDAVEVLRTLPAQSAHCVITSPPYYGLRDYGVAGQIGLEATPEEYVAKLVAVFSEVRRVLRDDGTLWLNLGDTYATNGGAHGGRIDNQRGVGAKRTHDNGGGDKQERRAPEGLKPKDLIGIPWRVAFALQNDGWYLRQDIIWAKPNPMPESVTDRCTKAHEYVFLLSKSARYWYDNEAVKEEAAYDGRTDTVMKGSDKYKDGFVPNQSEQSLHARGHERWQWRDSKPIHNRRSVWTVATQPYSGAHFATFPPKLIEPMILAGCPAQCCPVCGAGWERVENGERIQAHWKGTKQNHAIASNGFRPTCACDATASVPGVVLDPFGGAGTTALVALRLFRRSIYIDNNAEYLELARARLAPVTAQGNLFTEVDNAVKNHK